MSSISAIINDLKYSRAALLEAIEGLSVREMTETPIYDGWTIKAVLAHVIGWDRRVIEILPLILADRAGEVPGVEVLKHNQAAVAAYQERSLAETLADVQATHRQIVEMLSAIDHKEIDRRHNRQGRVITIRSYIINIMADHARQHAAEIELWRKRLAARRNPAVIAETVARQRAQFMARLAEIDGAANEALAGVAGHVLDWERRILTAARHIYDPSRPPAVTPAAPGATRSWAAVCADLRAAQDETAEFIKQLLPGDWELRGPYPWPNDQGTLAELFERLGEHYHHHLPDLA